MKHLLNFCFLFAASAGWGQQAVDTNFHVYLLLGQSNMAGRGVPDGDSKKIHPQIFMLDSADRWVPATDPVHFDKPALVGVGPGIAFAGDMLAGQPSIRIGLIPCALGGSPISVWEPGALYLDVFHPYEDALARAHKAMGQGVLKGVLWHQGESDNDTVRAGMYLEKLKTLVGRLRTDLYEPGLPFVAGEVGHFNRSDFINAVINRLPEKVPHTAVVSARGLTDKGDHLHFDTPSARALGKRYAEAMKKLQAAGAGTNLYKK